MKRTRMRTTAARDYLRPETCIIRLSADGRSHLLFTSNATPGGQFDDMDSGGDLGGDGNDGMFEDMGWGGNLGGNSGNSGSFGDMDWGGDLGGNVTGN